VRIVAVCGAGLGTSGILKVNAERALARLEIEADVTASDIASLATTASDAQIILTSPELVDKIPPTWADIVVIQNYVDLAEIEQKLLDALG
jgi:PTS system ascorbate-specific IIB component